MSRFFFWSGMVIGIVLAILFFPIYLETCTLSEYISDLHEISTNEAEGFILENVDKYVKLKDTDKILNRNITLNSQDGAILANFTAECERKIGVEQMIPKGE